jgi:DNA invertase Pin-like site-specific DNA recombinase
MRVALYARYSSDQQREASIADQIRDCRQHAGREQWTVVQEYTDAAMSGASRHRPGFQALMRDARRRDFDLVVAESLDRLSRDQEDTANLFKVLSFVGVRIVTLAEGDIGPLQIGFKGTMGAIFLKDLADKTRRGLRGRVEAGKSGGGLCYGYRVVRALGEHGVTTGEREIEPNEAAVVVRIFHEFVAGVSPKAIAKRLNSEHVSGPGGGTWGPSTIHGHAGRGTGILNNELYIGCLVWNRQRYIKDPDTGRRVSRRNPPATWITTPVPAQRIISDELWQSAKARQAETRHLLPPGTNLGRVRRPTYLFSGLTKCGVCGSGFTMFSKSRLACCGARDRGICTNGLTIRREEVERRVLKAMAERLWNQELFEEFCQEFTRERNRLHGEATAAAAAALHEQGAVQREIAKAVHWVTHEWNGEKDALADSVRTELATLERRKGELAAIVEAAQRAQHARPLLHPEMGKLYRDWVIEARDGLNDADRRTGATAALRAMVEEIVLTPEGEQLGIVLKGDLAAMLAAASPKAESSEMRRQVTLVAGGGFEPPTFGL